MRLHLGALAPADEALELAVAQALLRQAAETGGLADPVQPRAVSTLVHGELGPDHVLLDRRGEPVLIDIEGAKYFDAETEHVWTRMRFGEHYAKLNRGGLDKHRLRLYQLCMHLTWSRDPCGSRIPATLSVSGSAAWPSTTSTAPCNSGLKRRPPEGAPSPSR